MNRINTSSFALFALAPALGGLLLASLTLAQPDQAGGDWTPNRSAQTGNLPDGPIWGRGGSQPVAANQIFATADGCATCHSASPGASALWSNTGHDVSPHGMWQGTIKANAARDPYWRAQLAAEIKDDPSRAKEFEALCMRCHTPMGHHTAEIAGLEPLSVDAAANHPLFGDGVSCTVCHQIQPDNLGTKATFDGQPVIKPGRVIFGPFHEPATGPMEMHAAYTPKQGLHIRSSAMCASCHTLETGHPGGAGTFPEQVPYYEWRNSVYSTEVESPGDWAMDCQTCHMPGVGSMRIARNPHGQDFNILKRSGVRAHTFVGANAFMLDMLRENAEELGVTAPPEAFEQAARATRALLARDTATVHIGEPRREKTDQGETLVFDVTVTNLSGHKLPTAYPSRRVWIEALVRDGGTPIFDSGDFDIRGRLIGVEDELEIPHYDVITSPDQVAVYEMTAKDTNGQTTTILTRMAERKKDNRLLPRGWSPTGPHADVTAPVGVNGDSDFVGGSDTVTYRVPLPEGTGDNCTIIVWLWLQTIPPAWVEHLRDVDAEETERFIRMYDAASPLPERLALSVRRER